MNYSGSIRFVRNIRIPVSYYSCSLSVDYTRPFIESETQSIMFGTIVNRTNTQICRCVTSQLVLLLRHHLDAPSGLIASNSATKRTIN